MPIAVIGLFVYPVKSCRGIAVSAAPLEPRGLRHDRRLMIVDEGGGFLTQRVEPRLALVETAIEETPGPRLTLTAPGMGGLHVPLERGAAETGSAVARRRVTVWRDEVEAADCGDEAAAWISEWLGRRASIVRMPDDVERAVNPTYARPGDIVGFADGYPVLLASTASLEDVNARLAQPIGMNRFRPNVVVTGAAPWAEDGWTRIRVGAVDLRVVKPCDRCTVTTIDPQTGERGVEPLRTLATFRKKDNDVLFAQNCIPDTWGTIAVGDPVDVLA
jgi:uncharacterized protein YcbX